MESERGETFFRACIDHKLELIGLDCPLGHLSSLKIPHRGQSDIHLAWLVVHASSGCVVATVRSNKVTWWFEGPFEQIAGKLGGREADGQSNGAAALRARLSEAGRLGGRLRSRTRSRPRRAA